MITLSSVVGLGLANMLASLIVLQYRPDALTLVLQEQPMFGELST